MKQNSNVLFTSHILVTRFSSTYHRHIEIFVNNCSISSMYCVYVYRTILSMNSHYFPVQHSPTGISKGEAHCSLWGLKWIFTRSVGRRVGEAWASFCLKKVFSSWQRLRRGQGKYCDAIFCCWQSTVDETLGEMNLKRRMWLIWSQTC